MVLIPNLRYTSNDPSSFVKPGIIDDDLKSRIMECFPHEKLQSLKIVPLVLFLSHLDSKKFLLLLPYCLWLYSFHESSKVNKKKL
ncbi:hypothetical protein Ahy_A09g042344 isoform C [Arachis hypogaea]|uniref:Uncharacterized protein n=1 Tax=Arachis hypogaea TaxID=3818 RepID=A0A445BFJ9_ARAHY|nr:hypothetical protein Ahy_A09g042344 isoform C [Arachis hypogaea]